MPTAANISYYARIVREKAILRSLISTATEIATRGYEEQGNVEEFLDAAEKVIFDISEKKIKASFVAVGDMITDTLKTIDKLYQRKEMVTGVPTGYEDLDKITAGLQPADLIIVAGRPGMGKTAFALNIAANAAYTGVGAAIFSLEMAKEQLVLRMLCSEARVNSSKVRSGYLGERDFPQLAKAAGRLARSADLYRRYAGHFGPRAARQGASSAARPFQESRPDRRRLSSAHARHGQRQQPRTGNFRNLPLAQRRSPRNSMFP